MTGDFNERIEQLRLAYQDKSIADRRWDGATPGDQLPENPPSAQEWVDGMVESHPLFAVGPPAPGAPAQDAPYAGVWLKFSRSIAWIASGFNEHMRVRFGGRPGYFTFSTMSPDGRFVLISHRWDAGDRAEEEANAAWVMGVLFTLSHGQIALTDLDTTVALDRPPVTIGMNGKVLPTEP